MSSAHLSPLSKIAYCPSHREHMLSYCCFDPECSLGTLTCVLCLKNYHSLCKNEFIVFINDVFRRVQFSAKKLDKHLVSDLQSSVGEIMDLFVQKVMISLEAKRRATMSEIEKKFVHKNIVMEKEAWKNQKDTIRSYYDEAQGKVVLTLRINSNVKNLAASMKNFEKQSNQVYDDMLNRFGSLRLLSRRPFPFSRWRVHPGLYVEDQADGSVTIGSLKKNYDDQFMLVVLNHPFKRFLIEVEIKEFDPSNKTVEVGVMDSDGFVTLENTLTERPGEGIICYWNGISGSPNVHKAKPDSKSTVTSLQTGSKFFFEADESNIKWYDAPRIFEYHCINKGAKHFLYFAITNPQTSIAITYIS